MKKLFFLFLLCLSAYGAGAQIQNTDEALGYSYYQNGEFDKAVSVFGKLYNENNDRFFDIYFSALLKVKNYAEAEKVVKKMVRAHPGDGVYAISLGRVYMESGKKALADKTFESALTTLPKDEFKIRDIANAFYRIESYDVAAKVFIEGRKLLNDEKLFTFDLLGIYRFKKDKELLVQEYISALAYMPEILFQAQNTLASIFESNTDYDILQGILLKKIQKEPDKEIYTELLIWQFLQKKDYEMALRQLIAQDKRTKGKGAQLYNAANTFIYNQAYPVAIKTYEYLLSKGKDTEYYLPARLELVNTKYLLATSGKFETPAITDLADQYDAILKEYGKVPQTLFALKRWANLQAYYLNSPKKAEAALEDALKIGGLPASEIGQIKLDLGDIYVLTGQPWEAVLLYEQVAKRFENSVTGNEANYKAARLSFYQGNFEYAKSQADILKASTTQLIANDALNLSLMISDNLQNSKDSLALKMYADAEMLQFRNLIPASLAKLDSIAIAFPGNNLEDDIWLAKSKIYTKTGDFSSAAAALTKLTNDFPESIWADDALFTLADLYEKRLNDPEKAKGLYQKLITDHAGSMFTAEARKRFRALRGDIL